MGDAGPFLQVRRERGREAGGEAAGGGTCGRSGKQSVWRPSFRPLPDIVMWALSFLGCRLMMQVHTEKAWFLLRSPTPAQPSPAAAVTPGSGRHHGAATPRGGGGAAGRQDVVVSRKQAGRQAGGLITDRLLLALDWWPTGQVVLWWLLARLLTWRRQRTCCPVRSRPPRLWCRRPSPRYCPARTTAGGGGRPMGGQQQQASPLTRACGCPSDRWTCCCKSPGESRPTTGARGPDADGELMVVLLLSVCGGCGQPSVVGGRAGGWRAVSALPGAGAEPGRLLPQRGSRRGRRRGGRLTTHRTARSSGSSQGRNRTGGLKQQHSSAEPNKQQAEPPASQA